MTLRNAALRIIATTILLIPSIGKACDRLLSESQDRIAPIRLGFNKQESFIRSIAQKSFVFPVFDSPGRFWTVVFDPRASQKNQGYVLSGRHRSDDFMVEDIQRTGREGEKEYFKAVAQMHRMRDQLLTIKNRKLKCGAIQVAAWVEAKLWLKHRLTLAEVTRLLELPDWKMSSEMSSRDPRLRVQARGRNGQMHAIIIAEKSECPNVLVTAYAEHEQH